MKVVCIKLSCTLYYKDGFLEMTHSSQRVCIIFGLLYASIRANYFLHYLLISIKHCELSSIIITITVEKHEDGGVCLFMIKFLTGDNINSWKSCLTS